MLGTNGFALVTYKNSSGDDIPERNVTYHLICLLISLNSSTPVLPEYFSK